jgi:hypothetical protein
MRLFRLVRVAAVAMLLLVGAVVSPATATATSSGVELRTLSNRADLISGGDALMEVALTAPATGLKVLAGDRDVTAAFEAIDATHYRGVVDGLAVGPNVVTAHTADGQGALLTVVNHDIGGPVFSGPQIQPWYCLPGASDAQCNRPVSYTYQYMSSNTGKFAAYDPNNPPSDVKTTTTDQGKSVPYIVRIEKGNMDRSPYAISVLLEPGTVFTRQTGPPAWNHKVFEWYGAGCSMAHQEGVAPDVMQDLALSRGFAVMSTALSDNNWNCNIAVQAESIMMAKEHLIERYGDVRYLFGYGCSGGSIASLQIANAYPGLIDGVTVSCTMPDAALLDLLDCVNLLNYFESPTTWGLGVVWPENQQAAAAGMQSTSVCHAWVEAFHYPEVYQPKTGVGCIVPVNEPAKVYDPVTNPTGVRCSLQDFMSNVFGSRTADTWGPIEQKIKRGFAGRAYDNVGVMYGLRALQSGQISTAQFVDLNAKIGSRDIDYNAQPTRVTADPLALTAAYRSGFMNEGNNLDKVPIIDIPGYVPGDRYEIHDNTKSWALRARLDHFIGNHDSQVLWYGPEGPFQASFGTKVCDTAFGPSGNPRWAAGGSIAEDVIKCQLKPLVRSDYAPILFSDGEWTALQTAFPNGACDWSKLGVSQQPTVAWQSYQKGPGGEPLGNPPASQVDDIPATGVPEVPLAIVLPLVALALLAVGWRRAAR